ncbi:MAG: LysE family translocator [Pseudomonadota bacterium]
MLSADKLFAFAAIVVLLITSPGPNLFLLLRNTPVHGMRSGFAAILGFAVAIITHAVLSVLGIGTVMLSSPLGFATLKLLGALYLIWLGVRAFKAFGDGEAIAVPELLNPAPRTPSLALRVSFREGFLTNALNPKLAVFYLAIFPQFLETAGAPLLLQGMLFGAVHAVLAVSWYGLVVLGLSGISRWISSGSVWRTIRGLSGVSLIYLGFRLLTIRNENGG